MFTSGVFLWCSCLWLRHLPTARWAQTCPFHGPHEHGFPSSVLSDGLVQLLGLSPGASLHATACLGSPQALLTCVVLPVTGKRFISSSEGGETEAQGFLSLLLTLTLGSGDTLTMVVLVWYEFTNKMKDPSFISRTLTPQHPVSASMADPTPRLEVTVMFVR